jgi:transposase-like protein
MSLMVVEHRVTVDELARESGVHPELVRRLIGLGLLDEPPRPGAAAQLARAVRLRRDLGLNWAGAVFACELLARIDQLEERLARYEPRPPRWR